jgi:hypothetical protein
VRALALRFVLRKAQCQRKEMGLKQSPPGASCSPQLLCGRTA